MDTFLLDIRCAWRALARSRAFATGTILAVGVAVAATAIVFAVVHAVLLKPLPYERPDSLVWIWATRIDRDKAFFSIPNYLDFVRANTTLRDVAAFANWGVNVSGDGDPERLQAARVTTNTFSILGVRAAIGRAIEASDTASDDRVVVLTAGLWRRRFGGAPSVVGSRLQLNGEAYEVVGVLQDHFLFPGADAELFAPLRLDRDPRRLDRGTNFLRVFGRRRAEVTIQQARDDSARIARELRDAYPEPNAKMTAPRVVPLADELLGAHRAPLVLVLSGVIAVWLLGCTNIVNLQLIRLVSRERERTIRASLGASAMDLIESYLFEHLFLVTAGGLLGAALASVALPLLVRAVPASLPRSSDIRVDATVVAFTLAIVASTAIVVAVLPFVRPTRTHHDRTLRGTSAGAGVSVSQRRTRSGLAVIEVAAALCLLLATTFLLKALRDVQAIDPGVSLDGLVHTRVSLPARYGTQPALERFLTLTLDELTRLTGVTRAAAVNALPLSAQNIRTDFAIAGAAAASRAEIPGAQNRWVTSDYFDTAGIRVIEGRGFSRADDTARAPVAVVDEALRQQFWSGRSPVGDEIRILDGTGEGRALRIIGVVRNVTHFDVGEQPLGTLYGPVHQLPQANVGFFATNFALAVRTPRDSDELRRAIVQAVRRVDPDVPISHPRTMADPLRLILASRRFVALILAVFAVSGLVLAVSGVYTVISATARERRRELAIRLALGASAAAIISDIVTQAARLLLVGLPIGFAITAAALPMLTAATGVRSTEWWPWTVAPVLLSVTAMAATCLRARHVLDLDPAVTLRTE